MNKLYNFIITAPAVAILAEQKVITVASPDEGTATAWVINDVKKNNPGIKFSVAMVAEMEPDTFLKSLSLTKPIELKLEEEKPRNLQALIAYIKSKGYSIKKLTKKL